MTIKVVAIKELLWSWHPLPSSWIVAPASDMDTINSADVLVQANIKENKKQRKIGKYYEIIENSGKPWICAESAVFRRNMPHPDPARQGKTYHRFSWYSYFRDEGLYNNQNCPDDRWKQVQADQKLVVKEWRTKGEYILVTLQRPGDSSLKNLLAKHGDYLSKLAEKNRVNLEFEASVAGGIPILRTIKESLATNKISKVYGILNGTTNYILSEMENSNETFDKVLKKAQKLGYAEPGNPKLDLNGFDAFAKIRILSALSFNTKISKHKCIMEGIENIKLEDIKIANQLGLRVKLLGISEIINGQLFETVHPSLVSKNTYIGNVSGVMNAVITEGKPVGPVSYTHLTLPTSDLV